MLLGVYKNVKYSIRKLCLCCNFIQQQSDNTHTYHKGEGLGGHCFVVGVDAVPHTHLYLSLLHPVTCCIIQPAHNPEKGGERTSITIAIKINARMSRFKNAA